MGHCYGVQMCTVFVHKMHAGQDFRQFAIEKGCA